MNVSRPEDFHRSYAEAFNSGDVQSVVNLYEPNAVFVPQPDQVVSGHAAIAELPKQFQALGHMLGAMRYFISAGEVALASATWQISGGDPDGKPIDVRETSADLLRRQPDGRWLLVVDHPFGAG
jgi:ketosteroid isomerase-like protein